MVAVVARHCDHRRMDRLAQLGRIRLAHRHGLPHDRGRHRACSMVSGWIFPSCLHRNSRRFAGLGPILDMDAAEASSMASRHRQGVCRIGLVWRRTRRARLGNGRCRRMVGQGLFRDHEPIMGLFHIACMAAHTSAQYPRASSGYAAILCFEFCGHFTADMDVSHWRAICVANA